MDCYNDFGSWLRSRFPYKVQKISVDAGFTCPNRDGHVSFGGCIFCNNKTFNPSYTHKNNIHEKNQSLNQTVKQQIEEGKQFFSRKYPNMRYIAYFQAYSNTYAPLETLRRKYEEALDCEDVVGLVIGTRPDCVNDKILDYIEKLSRQTFVIVEYGIESTNEQTLFQINRGHTFECARKTIEDTALRGIITGGHVILGLPCEDANENLKQADIISSTKLNILKIHQLQIVKGTVLAQKFATNPFKLYTLDEYIALLTKYIQRLRPDIILERFTSQSPKNMLIAPDWGIKNHEFTNLLVNHMKKLGARQGQLYNI